MVMGDPTRGIDPPTILTSSTCGLRPPPRRIASGWASCTNAERSDWRGGRVFCRHTHGVPFEQNPQPPLGRLSLREVGDKVFVVKEDVKSISTGYDCGVGRIGAGVFDRLRLILCFGEDGGGGDCFSLVR